MTTPARPATATMPACWFDTAPPWRTGTPVGVVVGFSPAGTPGLVVCGPTLLELGDCVVVELDILPLLFV